VDTAERLTNGGPSSWQSKAAILNGCGSLVDVQVLVGLSGIDRHRSRVEDGSGQSEEER
jgi:hypothetical protein